MYKAKMKRAKCSCLYYGSFPGRERGAAMCTLTTYEKCDPDKCAWYRSQKMADESYENARRIWKKNHGTDDYDALGYGPRKRYNPTSEEE